MRLPLVLVGLMVLTGCALEPEPVTTAALPSDPVCKVAADARASDAAFNGYDGLQQAAIRQDSYQSCLAWSKKTILLEVGRH